MAKSGTRIVNAFDLSLINMVVVISINIQLKNVQTYKKLLISIDMASRVSIELMQHNSLILL
jgi:hypothetical protein